MTDGVERLIVRAEKIPGQKKITANMTDEKKLSTAAQNEDLRRAEVWKAEKESGKRIMLIGKFLNLGIPDGGHYDSENRDHRELIVNVGKPPGAKQPPKPKEQPPKPAEPQPPSPPRAQERAQKTFQWLKVNYKGLRFKIVLTLIDQREVWEAEATIKVKKLPRLEEEYVYLEGDNESTIWSEIGIQLREMTQGDMNEIFRAILAAYTRYRSDYLE